MYKNQTANQHIQKENKPPTFLTYIQSTKIVQE